MHYKKCFLFAAWMMTSLGAKTFYNILTLIAWLWYEKTNTNKHHLSLTISYCNVHWNGQEMCVNQNCIRCICGHWYKYSPLWYEKTTKRGRWCKTVSKILFSQNINLTLTSSSRPGHILKLHALRQTIYGTQTTIWWYDSLLSMDLTAISNDARKDALVANSDEWSTFFPIICEKSETPKLNIAHFWQQMPRSNILYFFEAINT